MSREKLNLRTGFNSPVNFDSLFYFFATNVHVAAVAATYDSIVVVAAFIPPAPISLNSSF